MRRAQTLRHAVRPSSIAGVDDLGVLREQSEETLETQLRRQLIELERENDRLKTKVNSLQEQLSQRPPLNKVQELQQDCNNLESMFEGSQRENKKLMEEIASSDKREKQLEAALTKLAGDNWQSMLGIAPIAAGPFRRAFSTTGLQHGSSPKSEASFRDRNDSVSSEATPMEIVSGSNGGVDVTKLVESIRLMVIGVQERSKDSEVKLRSMIDQAQSETTRLQALQQEVEV